MAYLEALEFLIVRKQHVICGRCTEIAPIYPGNGTPAISFIMALEQMAKKHKGCKKARKGRD